MDPLDRWKYSPPDDIPMLPWYQGAFEHGFIALHPFFVVDGLNPSSCESGTLVLTAADRPEGTPLLEWWDRKAEENSNGKEIDGRSLKEISKRFGRNIGWLEICEDLGLPDHCALDRALRTIIDGLRSESADQETAERLIAHCSHHQIFLPTEGDFQPTMEAQLVSLLERAGLSEVIVGDEFGDDERLMPVASLAGYTPWATRSDFPDYGARRLIAPDHSLLLWVHWDSFYTAIFGTKERMVSLGLAANVEGFWCSNENTTFWMFQNAVQLANY